MTYTLFALEDGDLIVNREEARKIKEYRDLFTRDKGSEGDSDGRKKYIACAEIYYIYLLHDPRSIYYNLSREEVEVKARKDAKLPDNWVEDEVLQKAIDRYKEDFKLTSQGRSYIVAEKAYHTTIRQVEFMQETLASVMNDLEKKALAYRKITSKKDREMETNTQLSEVLSFISEATSIQSKLMKNIGEFDKLGKTVSELSEKFALEGGNLKIPVGGGELYNREE